MSYNPKSKFTVYVSGLSSVTRSHDIKKTFGRIGTVLDVERDKRECSALVEFKRESDAKYAWDKYDGKNVDGRSIKVDWATKKDFKDFGWKWWEASPSPSRSRSRSRSAGSSR